MKPKITIHHFKKAVYFCDWNYSTLSESPEHEFKNYVRDDLEKNNITYDNIQCSDDPDMFDKKFDLFLFDYGGVGFGNSLLQSNCKRVVEHAREHPNRIYIMVSQFTREAMKDLLYDLEQRKELLPANVFLSPEDYSNKMNGIYKSPPALDHKSSLNTLRESKPNQK